MGRVALLRVAGAKRGRGVTKREGERGGRRSVASQSCRATPRPACWSCVCSVWCVCVCRCGCGRGGLAVWCQGARDGGGRQKEKQEEGPARNSTSLPIIPPARPQSTLNHKDEQDIIHSDTRRIRAKTPARGYVAVIWAFQFSKPSHSCVRPPSQCSPFPFSSEAVNRPAEGERKSKPIEGDVRKKEEKGTMNVYN